MSIKREINHGFQDFCWKVNMEKTVCVGEGVVVLGRGGGGRMKDEVCVRHGVCVCEWWGDKGYSDEIMYM